MNKEETILELHFDGEIQHKWLLTKGQLKNIKIIRDGIILYDEKYKKLDRGKTCECGHPKNEHLETVGECRHFLDPTLKEVNKSGENAHGVYCNCKNYLKLEKSEGEESGN